jgi:electron transport complex protein RnfB
MSSFTSLAARIDALLPQTQCTKCGYAGCAPYAEAIANDATDINRCPPGGAATIAALAALTGRPARPLDPQCGVEAPRVVARVEEDDCIGCTLCIQACPVDAIIGAPKRMHVVLSSLCTGCELCVPPCPVDCIALDAAGTPWSAADAAAARAHYQARNHRLARGERIASRVGSALRGSDSAPGERARNSRRAVVAAALARARARRRQRSR